jgi:transaldolase
MPNPLLELRQHGQSIWYDNIRRGLLTSGALQRLITEDGICGMTSNPAIFEKAISGSQDYAGVLRSLSRTGRSAQEIYEAIAVEDIQWAADLLLPVYERSAGRDGYVSLEVSPHLAHDSRGTVVEARRLFAMVGRPNLMIKVPGTPAGAPAVEQLISEGINVNITLLFAREHYVQVAHAYMAGLERLIETGGDPSRVASVASFFISRIDGLVDKQIDTRLQTEDSASRRRALRALRGRIAIASAKLTYDRYKELNAGERWRRLAARSARSQRLLWASTSTKDPAYSDVLYVEELIGADTVNTVPQATLDAFRDHGRVRPSLEEGLEEAREAMVALEELGISMQEVAARLQEEAVRLFVEPFDALLDAVEMQRQGASAGARIAND